MTETTPEAREEAAKAIFEAMRWAADNSCTDKHPEWEEGGNSLAQVYARLTAAALSPPAISEAVEAEREGANVTYTQFQQRRGRLPDLIEEAIGIYDGFMNDDDYDSQHCLDRIADKLKSARDWYDATTIRARTSISEVVG